MYPTQGTVSSNPKTTTLFVPSWTIGSKTRELGRFDQYIYFGLTPTPLGISETDSVKQFRDLTPAHNKLLAIAMTNSEANFAILKQPDSQKKIISDAVIIAKKDGFSGIVLDLEVSALPFPSLEEQITKFTQLFESTTKKSGLSFSLTVFGDTFYRIRPFDIKTIAKDSDTVWIMSYDFSKARGNPGPNFPLHGKGKYGYDMATMADNFLQFVPNKKIGVIFGLFGYDWIVDSKGNAISREGVPLTDRQIQKQFLSGCEFQDCIIHRDPDSSETEIHYTDDFGNRHIVWFEDMQSVAQKEAYLESRGITSFSYWAYSYF